MRKLEATLLGLFIAVVVILITFCFGWWIAYGIYKILGLSEIIIEIGMILGIIVGIITAKMYFRKWMNSAYDLDNYKLVCIHLVLSIGTIGFFMGVPVFNIIPCALAGIFTGRKSKHINAAKEEFMTNLKRVSWLNLLILTIICIFSAVLALTDSHTAANLQGMFNIKSFQVTKLHIIAIILFGGTCLLSIQHFLTRKLAILAYKAG